MRVQFVTYTFWQYRASWILLQTWGYEIQVMWWNQLTAPDDEVFDLSQIQPITVAQFEAMPVNLRISLSNYRSCLGGERKQKKQLRQRSNTQSTAEPFWNTFA